MGRRKGEKAPMYDAFKTEFDRTHRTQEFEQEEACGDAHQDLQSSLTWIDVSTTNVVRHRR